MTKTAKPPKYEALSSGQLDQIRKMAKDKGVTRDDFQNGLRDGTVAAMLDNIRAKRPGAHGFPIWKTIKLGTGLKTAGDFCLALEQAGCRIGDWGKDILSQKAFSVSKHELSVDLVRVSVGELGFANGAIRAEIYERAKKLGLGLCPSEVGPQLRLQYLEQPLGEWLRIGMEPITDSDGALELFDVEHNDNGRWLNGYDGHPGYWWDAGSQFVFVSRKS